MRVRSPFIGIIAVALCGTLLALWFIPAGPGRAPDLTINSLDGSELKIGAANGSPLLVNFWATSCRGCMQEMPHLAQLYAELAPRGLEVIGIAMAYDPPNRVIAMRRARNIPYPIALDPRGEIARAFGDVDLIPASFLIAPDGRILYQQTGQLDIEQVRSLVSTALAQQDDLTLRLAGR